MAKDTVGRFLCFWRKLNALAGKTQSASTRSFWTLSETDDVRRTNGRGHGREPAERQNPRHPRRGDWGLHLDAASARGTAAAIPECAPRGSRLPPHCATCFGRWPRGRREINR